MKLCTHCGEPRGADDFYPSRPHKCKACCLTGSRAWRDANPEAARRLSREAYRSTRAARMAGVTRSCEHCGDELDAQKPTNAKFCSQRCARDAVEDRRRAAVREGRAGRLCERCGDEIPDTRNLKATTCSVKCRDALNELQLNRRKCRSLSHFALKVGRLQKQPCEICGSPDVEMHHLDYFEPLNVRWLCFLHHRTLMHGNDIRKENVK